MKLKHTKTILAGIVLSAFLLTACEAEKEKSTSELAQTTSKKDLKIQRLSGQAT